MHQKTKPLEVMIEVKCSLVELEDLPDEILLTIFQKLDNASVLNALMHVSRRLNTIVLDPLFTSHLALMKQMLDDSIHPLSDSILDRFCSQILPEIHCHIKRLDLEPSSMERIFLAADYPNLCGLGLFGISIETAVCLVTGKRFNSFIDWKKRVRMKIQMIYLNSKYRQFISFITDLFSSNHFLNIIDEYSQVTIHFVPRSLRSVRSVSG